MSPVRLLVTWATVSLLIVMANPTRVLVARPSQKKAEMPSTSVPEASVDPDQCRTCHSEEVKGFARSKMARSMRIGGLEPAGEVQVPGTKITMHSDEAGSWQTLKARGSAITYHVDYVIGSGTHASGYVSSIADHLFQSPVAYYLNRSAYGLAPGYENKPDPDFTRPITEGCVFCHSGSFDAIAGTQNSYGPVPFPHLAIGCDRCHGSPVAHLTKPEIGNIVNPAELEAAARDSVCEQCHLIGVARILNPGKQFTDFRPGKPLEDTFTIYYNQPSTGTGSAFKVISHSEQLALSKCARGGGGGKLWCGTCHDPHNEPTTPVSFYRERCLLCHSRTTFAASHPAKTSNCIGCHMPKREAEDGGHGVFTDHHIQRRPEHGAAAQTLMSAPEIAPWRDPPADLATRNLGLALIEAGMERRSSKEILSGYRALTGVQKQFPRDSEMYNALGAALLAGRQYGEAVQAFELAVRFAPASSPKEASLGQAYLALGEEAMGERHLERAMELDPLNLSAAALLIEAYDKSGKPEKSDQLSKRIADLTQTKVDRR